MAPDLAIGSIEIIGDPDLALPTPQRPRQLLTLEWSELDAGTTRLRDDDLFSGEGKLDQLLLTSTRTRGNSVKFTGENRARSR